MGASRTVAPPLARAPLQRRAHLPVLPRRGCASARRGRDSRRASSRSTSSAASSVRAPKRWISPGVANDAGAAAADGRAVARGGPRTTPTPRAPASCRASAPRRGACRAPATRLCSLRRRPSWQPAREATPRAGRRPPRTAAAKRARKPRAPWARWARTARASSYGHALLPPIVKKACAASTRNPGGKILLALASQPSVSAGKFSARFTVRFSSHESCGGILNRAERVLPRRVPQQHQQVTS